MYYVDIAGKTVGKKSMNVSGMSVDWYPCFDFRGNLEEKGSNSSTGNTGSANANNIGIGSTSARRG